MIVIQTQYRENYGTVQEPYWKFKGGSDYKVKNAPDLSEEELIKFIMSIRPRIEYRESMSEEYILDWFIAEDDYLSEFERSQLKFDGKISHREPSFDYKELVNE